MQQEETVVLLARVLGDPGVEISGDADALVPHEHRAPEHEPVLLLTAEPTAGIAGAASLHLYSTLIDAVRPHEYSEEFSGDPSTILSMPIPRRGGVAILPKGPGLGIELDEAAVDRMAVDA